MLCIAWPPMLSFAANSIAGTPRLQNGTQLFTGSMFAFRIGENGIFVLERTLTSVNTRKSGVVAQHANLPLGLHPFSTSKLITMEMSLTRLNVSPVKHYEFVTFRLPVLNVVKTMDSWNKQDEDVIPLVMPTSIVSLEVPLPVLGNIRSILPLPIASEPVLTRLRPVSTIIHRFCSVGLHFLITFMIPCEYIALALFRTAKL